MLADAREDSRDSKTSVWTARKQVVEFDAGVDYAEPAAYTTIRFLCKKTSDTTGARFQLSEIEYFETNLVVTKTADDGSVMPEIVGPVDPAEVGLDPLTLL